ncbi:MAG: uroporphyrinogen decarboxylase [Planctomycetota bacterium]|nr:uroporphyrinogen decarboxylase [Planctomycetota bacterium]
MPSYPQTLDRLVSLIRERRHDQTMAALIIDSPWLPGYAGVGTLDFYFDPATWIRAHEKTVQDLPGVAFVPGSWVELGMTAEPSGWGVPIQWSPHQPPGVHRYPGDLAALADVPTPNPETDGLMPIILRQYERMKQPLADLGLAPRMAACRGPLAIAAHLLGVTEMLMATQLEPELCQQLFDKTTELCTAWLRAQLDRMDQPVGVLVLDDLVGMLSPDDAATFGLPRLKRIFDQFPGLIHIFHNDSVNEKVFPGLATIGMDVFNFSHETDLARARQLLGPDIVLMGNLAPLQLLVRGTPDQVRQATRRQLDRLAEVGPLLISAGGGVSPGTPIENLQAMCGELD